MPWVRALNEEALVGGPACATVADRRIAFFKQDGAVFAIDDTCTHLDASLSEGAVKNGSVICPWHGVQFDLQTGAASGPPARGDVRAYPCRIEDGDVWIEID